MKDGKKTQPKLDLCVNKESTIDKGIMTDLVEVEILSKVEVQTMRIPSISTNKHLMINKGTQLCKESILQRVNEEYFAKIKEKDKVIGTPYQYPNYTSQFFNQSIYQHQQKHIAYVLNTRLY